MKKISRYFLLLLALAGVLSLLPLTVRAAVTERTLQPGRVYTFTGRDSRVISHVSVTGTGRNQVVVVNAGGSVTRYGLFIGRISVYGTGHTMVTPPAPTRVSFNPAQLTLSYTTGETLRRLSVTRGQTLAITNTGRDSHPIRTDNAAFFDLVITNTAGIVTNMQREIRFPQINVPTGHTATLTALDGDITVYFPAFWDEGTMRTQYLSEAVIVTHRVYAGVPFILRHSGEHALTVEVEPLYTRDVFAYAFITRDRQGFPVGHGEQSGNSITVAPNRPVTITPHMDAILIFPLETAHTLEIAPGTHAPPYYLMEAGHTLSITNSDANNSYPVTFTSEPSGYAIVYDFVLETADGITFGLYATAPRIEIPPGGRLTVTAGTPPEWAPQRLAVRFAYSERITLAAAPDALARYEPEAGISLLLRNNGEERIYALTLTADPDEALDYVRTDTYGEILSFGAVNPGRLSLEPGTALHVSHPNAEGTLGLVFPQALCEAGFSAVKTEAPALHHPTPEPGRSLFIQNIGEETISTLVLTVENNEPLDYVRINSRGMIHSFGTIPPGRLSLEPGTAIHLSHPCADESFTLIYPHALNKAGLVIEKTDLPTLYRHSPEPGQSLLVHNDSEEAIATLVLTVRYNTPLNYVRTNTRGEVLSFGTITPGRFSLEPGSTIRLSHPYELESFTLMYPYALREAGLSTEKTGVPTLYRHTPQPGQSLLVHNDGEETITTFVLTVRYNTPLNYVRTNIRGEILSFGTIAPGRFSLEPGSTIHLSHPYAQEDFTLMYPYALRETSLSTEKTTLPALYRHTPEPGQSLLVRNDSEETITHLVLNVEYNRPLDYVRADAYGEILSFGAIAPGRFSLEPGTVIHLSHPYAQEAFTLLYPYALREAGLSAIKTDAPALFRHTLEPGEAIRVDNINNRFNRPLFINGNFDYVLTDNVNTVLEYGIRATSLFTLRYSSRMTIGPTGNERVHITFPAVWRPQFFRVVHAPNPPLIHITVRPGEAIRINNTTAGVAFVLSTNAQPGGAGFFLRDSMFHDWPIPPEMLPGHGSINIRGNSLNSLTAARGEVLHIWTPYANARRLRFIV